MIELNLLPQELRNKKKDLFRELPDVPLIPICVSVLAVLFTIHGALIFTTATNKELLKKLESKWAQIQPDDKKTNEVAEETSLLEKKAAALREIAVPGIRWAGLLKGLNKAIIADIWLSELKLTGDSPLVLEVSGYALGKSEKATSVAAKFITSLEMSKNFADYFERIELKNMQNSEFDGEECMTFELVCVFKSEKVKVKN